MKNKILCYATLILSTFFSSLYSYWCDIPYETDIKDHKRAFIEWVHAKQIRDYDRVLLGISCDDCDNICKHSDAGKVIEATQPYQIMHNGLKVIKDCYGSWMTDLIYGLKGHHEPQEERVFYEVLKYIPSNATMIEAGSWWAFYSMWFSFSSQDAKNYLIEPDQDRLNTGISNFALNLLPSPIAVRGYFGMPGVDAGNFHGAKKIHIDFFVRENGIEHIDILHSDIQGAEYDMLLSAKESIANRIIDYIFVSTHGLERHQNCLEFLKQNGYFIIAEHTPQESFTVDGLIVGRRAELKGCEKVHISKCKNH